jgi:hypothetical protein
MTPLEAWEKTWQALREHHELSPDVDGFTQEWRDALTASAPDVVRGTVVLGNTVDGFLFGIWVGMLHSAVAPNPLEAWVAERAEDKAQLKRLLESCGPILGLETPTTTISEE